TRNSTLFWPAVVKKRGDPPEHSRFSRTVWIPNDCFKLGQQHGLVPLLYRKLSRATAGPPSSLLESIRRQDEINAHRTLWLTRELLHIHKALTASGLEVLPYKGPILAQCLYGNLGIRQFSDLDLLVRP